LGKILLKILKMLKKLKKKKYSLIPLLRIYEENLKAEEREREEKKNIESKYVKYIYIYEPREYPFDTTPRAEWKEKSIWDIDLPIIINNKL
jgi:hypothetical protein